MDLLKEKSRSVVMSLSNNNLGNYWTSSGPYDEMFYYIRNNVDAVRDDIAVMISGNSVPARVREYAATSQELRTKEEILSAMVVYGFLSCENGMVSIPNKELMDQLVEMIGYDKSEKKTSLQSGGTENMKFIYPAVIRKNDTGTYDAFFPDLECCQASGDTLEEAVDKANEAAYDWLYVELMEDEGVLPAVSDPEDMELMEGDVVRNIAVNIRFTEGWDE